MPIIAVVDLVLRSRSANPAFSLKGVYGIDLTLHTILAFGRNAVTAYKSIAET